MVGLRCSTTRSLSVVLYKMKIIMNIFQISKKNFLLATKLTVLLKYSLNPVNMKV